MSKRRLTAQQKRQIRRIQERRRLRVQGVASRGAKAEIFLDPEETGLVVAQHGRRLIVEGSDRLPLHCHLRQNLGRIVCGDRVAWRRIEPGHEGVVTALMHRDSLLARPSAAGAAPKPVAANLDRILIVAAPSPPSSMDLIDRCLVAAATAAIEALVVLNKVDSLSARDQPSLQMHLDDYRKVGYRVLEVSAHTRAGLGELLEELRGRTAVMVGASGVGKSSLVQALVPDLDIAIGKLSPLTGLGTHTTSTSRLYHLPRGGDLIDSPGVRDFGLWHATAREIARGFREFTPLLGSCRFSDCTHTTEPGCLVREQARAGGISPRRLLSYTRMLASAKTAG